MAKRPATHWLPILDRALQAEIGIRFPLSGGRREYFRNELYEARKQSNDPRYDELTIFLPAGEASGEVWIGRKSVSLED